MGTITPTTIPVFNDFADTAIACQESKLSVGNEGAILPIASQPSGPEYGQFLITRALHSRISRIDVNTCLPGDENAFFVADMGEVYRHHRRWREALPRITPHYAVKCNTDMNLVSLLAKLGCGFDCASKTEIDQVLSLGVSPSRIVYAQPVKTKSFLAHARAKNVSLMTFDNVDELIKVKEHHPGAQLLLRIATDDSASLCQFSMKFGAALASVPTLLKTARKLELDIAGVAFHVGSGASDPNAFTKAVADARRVFDMAGAAGHNPRILDVGGGFSHTTFDTMATAVSTAIESFFPAAENPGLRLIAEPGRYFAASAYVLATNVIARRVVQENKTAPVVSTDGNGVDDWVKEQIAMLSSAGLDDLPSKPEDTTERFMLYVNDGVYGNFSNIIFDHQKPVPEALTCRGRFLRPLAFAGLLPYIPSFFPKYDPAVSEDPSLCPTPLTFDSRSEISTGFSSPRSNSVDDFSSLESVEKFDYSIWGPTCDGIDCVASLCQLEGQLEVGDWLLFNEMGAYTMCSATEFNGFTNKHAVIYVCSEPAALPYTDAGIF